MKRCRVKDEKGENGGSSSASLCGSLNGLASGGDHDKASDYIKTHCAPGTMCYANVSFQEPMR